MRLLISLSGRCYLDINSQGKVYQSEGRINNQIFGVKGVKCCDTVIRRNSKQSEKTRVSAKEKEEVS